MNTILTKLSCYGVLVPRTNGGNRGIFKKTDPFYKGRLSLDYDIMLKFGIVTTINNRILKVKIKC